VYNGLLIVLLVVLVALLVWRQNQSRSRAAREREERRARTDRVLARALRGDDRQARHTVGGGVWPELPLGAPESAAGAAGKPTVVQAVDIDILLGDEPRTVAEQARQQLGKPTTLLSGLAGQTTVSRAPAAGSAPGLSVLDGRIEVSLDALVVAWFAARGYVATNAPSSAQPISLLLRHRDDKDRSYAFFFDRGRLSAQRAGAMVEKARALGMNRLLVAAEHGAEPSVGSARLRDVLVMDWVALDRELKKLDFRIAAKIIAMARTRRAGADAGAT
jgi:hypothetical protein